MSKNNLSIQYSCDVIYKYTLILIHFFKFIKFHPVAQYNEQIYVLCEHAFSL